MEISVPGAGGDRFDNWLVGPQIRVKKMRLPDPNFHSRRLRVERGASALRREMGPPRRSNLSFLGATIPD